MNFEIAANIVEECCHGVHVQNGETVQAWSVVDTEIERLRGLLRQAVAIVEQLDPENDISISDEYDWYTAARAAGGDHGNG